MATAELPADGVAQDPAAMMAVAKDAKEVAKPNADRVAGMKSPRSDAQVTPLSGTKSTGAAPKDSGLIQALLLPDTTSVAKASATGATIGERPSGPQSARPSQTKQSLAVVTDLAAAAPPPEQQQQRFQRSPTSVAAKSPPSKEPSPVKSSQSSPSKLASSSPSKQNQDNHHDKHKKHPKDNESFASPELLQSVEEFLTIQIRENQCHSHANEIDEFLKTQLNEKQRKRYLPAMFSQLSKRLQDATTSELELQSSICALEQMVTAMGRTSPLQDMYTAEEEEMLELLFRTDQEQEAEAAQQEASLVI